MYWCIRSTVMFALWSNLTTQKDLKTCIDYLSFIDFIFLQSGEVLMRHIKALRQSLSSVTAAKAGNCPNASYYFDLHNLHQKQHYFPLFCVAA